MVKVYGKEGRSPNSSTNENPRNEKKTQHHQPRGYSSKISNHRLRC